MDEGETNVAPAITSSTVFARVIPDNTEIKVEVENIMTSSRAVKVSSELQMMTGAINSMVIRGTIRIRDVREIADLEYMWT